MSLIVIKNNYIIDSVSDKKYRLKANEISSSDNVKLLIPNKDYIVDYSNNRIRILYSNEKEQHGMSFDKTRELNLISTDKNDILSDVDILGIDNNGNVYVLSGLRNSNRNKYFADIFQVTVFDPNNEKLSNIILKDSISINGMPGPVTSYNCCIDNKGNIYQIQRGNSEVKIILWQK